MRAARAAFAGGATVAAGVVLVRVLVAGGGTARAIAGVGARLSSAAVTLRLAALYGAIRELDELRAGVELVVVLSDQ